MHLERSNASAGDCVFDQGEASCMQMEMSDYIDADRVNNENSRLFFESFSARDSDLLDGRDAIAD